MPDYDKTIKELIIYVEANSLYAIACYLQYIAPQLNTNIIIEEVLETADDAKTKYAVEVCILYFQQKSISVCFCV